MIHVLLVDDDAELRTLWAWAHAVGLSARETRVVEAVSKVHLRSQVDDPWLRRQLTPNYRIGCKRVLLSSDYYPALQQPNCKLITWPIVRLSEGGVQTAEGVEHQVDCVVFATAHGMPRREPAIMNAAGMQQAEMRHSAPRANVDKRREKAKRKLAKEARKRNKKK